MSKKLNCPECKNNIELEKEYSEGDVVECPFCGIELEVVGKNEDGSLRVEIIEEEK
ncbi:sulfonate ABC transporter [Candidatus Dojkabacteria bacterium]|nr:sulfonate ABC transporter [Candidatus Dojkabacteria bacterium]